ncbi:MAG: DNA translocase FtsK 4TM domain-containing protein [Acidobacteria bacterium]|nr:DNA translocase FtsK 4TM domain-containing protein [Acidobacteriota bacterium]
MGARRRTVSPRRDDAVAARGFWSEAAAIVIMAFAVLLVLSLASYRLDDPVPWPVGRWAGEPVRNVAGIVGALLSEILRQILGYAAWLVPPLLLLLGWELFWRRRGRAVSRILGSGLLALAAAACLHLIFDESAGPEATRAGGWFGSAFAHLLARLLNRWGALVASAAILGTSVLLVTRASLVAALRSVASRLAGLTRDAWLAIVRHREARRKEKLRLEVARRQRERRAAGAALAGEADSDAEPHLPLPIPVGADAGTAPGAAGRRAGRATAARQDVEAPAAPQPQFDFVQELPRYTAPPLSLLNASQQDIQVDEKDLVETARIITEKCREFDVTGQVIAIQPGPVVTVFEFKPDAGVKYSRIVTLADDLCLGIEAESVRIDRIAGKSTVGIEVPNKARETICLRELLANDRFQKAPSPLTIALGKEINGEPYYADLARMPHLLVAGSTGSGKSVCLNNVITSILYKASPDEVRFIMFDPKRLELGVYENIPHLLTPLVTDTRKASNALRWATLEMERRYKQLAEAGVRNIDQYNLVVRRELKERPAGGAPAAEGAGAPAPLPYVIIIVDELADLIMTTGAEVEESITRLAQMARAVGLHLILSTQRPSVDIITGVIKANFPCRIAMRVSSKVDSRTIIDSNGAEQLLGQGDMLFIPPGSARLIRLHGPLVTEIEATRIVGFLKKQAKPQYDESVTREEPQAGAGGAGGDEEIDPAYDQAVRMAVQMGQISVSHIQRRLKLGYARAARLVDMMERNGIVGPADGSKPREVLVEPDFLERLNQMHEEQV